MILVFPLTRLIVGTAVGTVASIVPLVIASFPFVARLVESSLREVNPNIIEDAQSMGASPMQIIIKVMIPESVPSLLSNFTIAINTILGYSAMSGIIGGGGLGKIAINYGYYRYKYLVMIFAVILLIALVQISRASAPTLQQRQTRDSKIIKHIKAPGREKSLPGALLYLFYAFAFGVKTFASSFFISASNTIAISSVAAKQRMK